MWWVQLSTAIISGLAFSTILTLVLIPSMLALPANIAAPAKWAYGKLRGQQPEPIVDAVAAEVPLDDLNEMMRTARAALPGTKPKLVAKRHPEDGSVIPLPQRIKDEEQDQSLPTAAE